VARVVRAVRAGPVLLRQHRHPDDRLVPQRDHLGGRPERPQDAHPGPRRGRSTGRSGST
jgi:hypothetical protein